MRFMFSGWPSLKELKLTNFNTENIIDMDWIFDKCKSLKK